MTAPQTSSNQNDLVEILQGFSLWLNSKSYSSSTIRNYLSDINAYFIFFRNSKPAHLNASTFDESTIFSSDTVSSYLQTIQKNPAYSRYLSSLSKFFQYSIDQNLVKIDPLKQAKKIKKPSIENIISNYQSFLIKKHFSSSTIRNYLNDLRQYIDFCNSQKFQNSNQNPPPEISSTSLAHPVTIEKKRGLLNKFNSKKLLLFKFKGRSPTTAGQRGLIEN